MKILKHSIPSGTLLPFVGGSVPVGFLLCDGSTVSRAQYPSLFAAIGVSHGAGDGSSTFHLPDLRGRFVRGADNMGTGASGRDPDASSRTASNSGGNTGNTIGSVQAYGNKAHSHRLLGGGVGSYWGGLNEPTRDAVAGYDVTTPTYLTNTSQGGKIIEDTGGGETRPQNSAAKYMIKV